MPTPRTHLPAPTRLPRLPWPLPALLGWLLAWAVFVMALSVSAMPGLAFALGLAASFGAAVRVAGAWRRVLVGAGFPLSAIALGAWPDLPPWAWLAALSPLLLLYPLRAWRDAPFFPTPTHALDGIDRWVVLQADARILDAGCGLGHGLRALHRVWPRARLEGVEWSPLLSRLAAWRCPWARVRHGDMWATSWADCHLVYLFQRPETMARAGAKAAAEVPAGGWLVSLEFEVPGWPPHARAGAPGGRPVWIYRIGDARCVAPAGSPARSIAAHEGR